jgi:hypothetical protein
VRHLATCSLDAAVDYFRCGACAYVWAIDKHGLEWTVHHITRLDGASR